MPAQRIAVVTGGGTGIGAAIARSLAGVGHRVVLAGRRREKLDPVAKEVGGQAVVCDVTRAEDVSRLAREAAGAAIVVNNAGVAPSAPFLKTEDATWARALSVNLMGTVAVTRAFLPAMLESGWGRVVNVASVAGKVGFRYTSAYCASKAAVLGLTRSLALEVASRGVTVNAVCPGWVDTDMSDAAVANIVSKTGMSAEAAKRTLAEHSPQKRLVTAEEVAALTLWLTTDAARNVTAQAINVDGGTLQS